MLRLAGPGGRLRSPTRFADPLSAFWTPDLSQSLPQTAYDSSFMIPTILTSAANERQGVDV
jgi:hypothetical protein